MEGVDIAKVCKADAREGVVPEHGVDCFGKLCAAGLVDATGVDPYPLAPVSFREAAALSNLVSDSGGLAGIFSCPLARGAEGLNFLEGRFLFVPDMRQYSIALFDSLRRGEIFEFGAIGAQEPHVKRDLSP